MDSRPPKRRRTGSRATLQFTFESEERCEAFKTKVEAMKRLLSPANGPPLDNVGLMMKLFEVAEASLPQRQATTVPQPSSKFKEAYCTDPA